MAVWPRARQAMRAAILVAVASRKDLFVAGIHHRTKHDWRDLHRVVDAFTMVEAAYEGILHGIGDALGHGVTALLVLTDQDAVAKQLRGEFRVRGTALQRRHSMATGLLGCFEEPEVRWVRGKENREAKGAAREALERELDRRRKDDLGL